VNKLISMFLKAPHLVLSHKQHLLDASLPPEVVPTREGTWIEAVSSEPFETVKSFVAKFPSESAVSVRDSQSAFSDPKVTCSTVYIRSNFVWLPEV
jgi:hypothetical protein